MLEELLLLKHANPTMKPNYIKIPVTSLCFCEKDIEFFNKVYMWLYEQKDWHTIKRTYSGGISYKGLILPAWDIEAEENGIELTILSGWGLWRIQVRSIKLDKDIISGTQAFKKFNELCKKEHIDLEAMKITNGKEVKETIESYIIKAERKSFIGLTFENVHHIDFHSSFPAGLVNCFPEFGPVIKKLYKERKTKKINKAILNHTIGYMQSLRRGRHAEWAHLSKCAIEDNNKRVRELAKRLKESGRVILLYNTDGIWYTGEIYHGAGEGPELGQWGNDHINCIFRMKSKGAYEYIENDIYYPVIRGRTKLDKAGILRTDWKWGDIFKEEATELKYMFQEGIGIIEKEIDDNEN